MHLSTCFKFVSEPEEEEEEEEEGEEEDEDEGGKRNEGIGEEKVTQSQLHKKLHNQDSFLEEEEDKERERLEKEMREQEELTKKKKESMRRRSLRDRKDEKEISTEEPKEGEVKEKRKRSSIKQKYQKRLTRNILIQETNQKEDTKEQTEKEATEINKQESDFVTLRNQKMDHNGNIIVNEEDQVNNKNIDVHTFQDKQQVKVAKDEDVNPDNILDSNSRKTETRKESVRRRKQKKSAFKKAELREVAGEDSDPYQVNDLFNFISRTWKYKQPIFLTPGVKENKANQINTNDEENNARQEQERQEEEQRAEIEGEEFKPIGSNSNCTVVAEQYVPRAMVKNELLRIQQEIVDEEEFELEASTSEEECVDSSTAALSDDKVLCKH